MSRRVARRRSSNERPDVCGAPGFDSGPALTLCGSGHNRCQARRARARGEPAHLVVHEDVCAFLRPSAAVGR